MTKKTLTFARYVGLGAATLVPALVVAQALPDRNNLQAGDLLRASDVLLLRDALGQALTRISTLEASAAAPLGKNRVYTKIGQSALIGTNQRANAGASCDDDDIAMSCTCGGTDSVGSGTGFMDTRSFQVNNPVGAASSCICNAEWLNPGMATVTAQVNCLRVP